MRKNQLFPNGSFKHNQNNNNYQIHLITMLYMNIIQNSMLMRKD